MASSSTHTRNPLLDSDTDSDHGATSDSNDEFASASEGDDDLPWEPVIIRSPTLSRQSPILPHSPHSHSQGNPPVAVVPTPTPAQHSVEVNFSSRHQQLTGEDVSQEHTITTTTTEYNSRQQQQHQHHEQQQHQYQHHHQHSSSSSSSSSTFNHASPQGTLSRAPKLRERMRQSPVPYSKIVKAYLDPSLQSGSRLQSSETVKMAWLQEHQQSQENLHDSSEEEQEVPQATVEPTSTRTHIVAAPDIPSLGYSRPTISHRGLSFSHVSSTPPPQHSDAPARTLAFSPPAIFRASPPPPPPPTHFPTPATQHAYSDNEEAEAGWGFDEELDNLENIEDQTESSVVHETLTHEHEELHAGISPINTQSHSASISANLASLPSADGEASWGFDEEIEITEPAADEVLQEAHHDADQAVPDDYTHTHAVQETAEDAWGYDDPDLEIDLVDTIGRDSSPVVPQDSPALEAVDVESTHITNDSFRDEDSHAQNDLHPEGDYDEGEDAWGHDDVELEMAEAPVEKAPQESHAIVPESEPENYPHIHAVHETTEDGWGYDDQDIEIDLVETLGKNFSPAILQEGAELEAVAIERRPSSSRLFEQQPDSTADDVVDVEAQGGGDDAWGYDNQDTTITETLEPIESTTQHAGEVIHDHSEDAWGSNVEGVHSPETHHSVEAASTAEPIHLSEIYSHIHDVQEDTEEDGWGHDDQDVRTDLTTSIIHSESGRHHSSAMSGHGHRASVEIKDSADVERSWGFDMGDAEEPENSPVEDVALRIQEKSQVEEGEAPVQPAPYKEEQVLARNILFDTEVESEVPKTGRQQDSSPESDHMQEDAEQAWGFEDDMDESELAAIKGSNLDHIQVSAPSAPLEELVLAHELDIHESSVEVHDRGFSSSNMKQSTEHAESDNEHDDEVRDILNAAQNSSFISMDGDMVSGQSSRAMSSSDSSHHHESKDRLGSPTVSFHTTVGESPFPATAFLPQESTLHTLSSLHSSTSSHGLGHLNRLVEGKASSTSAADSDSGSDIYGDLSTARAGMNSSSNRLNEILDDDDYLEHMERGVPMNRSISTPISDDEGPKFIVDDDLVELMERGEPRQGSSSADLEDEDEQQQEVEEEEEEVSKEPKVSTEQTTDSSNLVSSFGLALEVDASLENSAAASLDSLKGVSHKESKLPEEGSKVDIPVELAAFEAAEVFSRSVESQDNSVEESEQVKSVENVSGSELEDDNEKVHVESTSDDQDPENPFSDSAAMEDQNSCPVEDEEVIKGAEDQEDQIDIQADEPKEHTSFGEHTAAIGLLADIQEEDAWDNDAIPFGGPAYEEQVIRVETPKSDAWENDTPIPFGGASHVVHSVKAVGTKKDAWENEAPIPFGLPVPEENEIKAEEPENDAWENKAVIPIEIPARDEHETEAPLLATTVENVDSRSVSGEHQRPMDIKVGDILHHEELPDLAEGVAGDAWGWDEREDGGHLEFQEDTESAALNKDQEDTYEGSPSKDDVPAPFDQDVVESQDEVNSIEIPATTSAVPVAFDVDDFFKELEGSDQPTTEPSSVEPIGTRKLSEVEDAIESFLANTEEHIDVATEEKHHVESEPTSPTGSAKAVYSEAVSVEKEQEGEEKEEDAWAEDHPLDPEVDFKDEEPKEEHGESLPVSFEKEAIPHTGVALGHDSEEPEEDGWSEDIQVEVQAEEAEEPTSEDRVLLSPTHAESVEPRFAVVSAPKQTALDYSSEDKIDETEADPWDEEVQDFVAEHALDEEVQVEVAQAVPVPEKTAFAGVAEDMIDETEADPWDEEVHDFVAEHTLPEEVEEAQPPVAEAAAAPQAVPAYADVSDNVVDESETDPWDEEVQDFVAEHNPLFEDSQEPELHVAVEPEAPVTSAFNETLTAEQPADLTMTVEDLDVDVEDQEGSWGFDDEIAIEPEVQAVQAPVAKMVQETTFEETGTPVVAHKVAETQAIMDEIDAEDARDNDDNILGDLEDLPHEEPKEVIGPEAHVEVLQAVQEDSVAEIKDVKPVFTPAIELDSWADSWGDDLDEGKEEQLAEPLVASTVPADAPPSPKSPKSARTPSPLSARQDTRTAEVKSSDEEEDTHSPWQDISPASVSKRSEAGMSIGSEFESEYSVRSLDDDERLSPVPGHGHGHGHGHGRGHLLDRSSGRESRSGSESGPSKKGMESVMSWTDLKQDDEWHQEDEDDESLSRQLGQAQEDKVDGVVKEVEGKEQATVPVQPELPDISGADSWDFEDEDQEPTPVLGRMGLNRDLKTPDMSEHRLFIKPKTSFSSTLTPSPGRTTASYQSSLMGSQPTSPVYVTHGASGSSSLTSTTLAEASSAGVAEVEDDSHLPLAIRQQRARMAARGKPLPPISKYKSTKEASSSSSTTMEDRLELSPSPRLSAATAVSPAARLTPVSPMLNPMGGTSSNLSSSSEQKYLSPALQRQRERLEQKRAAAAAAASTPLSAARRLTVNETSKPPSPLLAHATLSGGLRSPKVASATLSESVSPRSSFGGQRRGSGVSTTSSVDQHQSGMTTTTTTTATTFASDTSFLSSRTRRASNAAGSTPSTVSVYTSSSTTPILPTSPLSAEGFVSRRSRDGTRPKTAGSILSDHHEETFEGAARSSQNDVFRHGTRNSLSGTPKSRSGWDDTAVEEEEGEKEVVSAKEKKDEKSLFSSSKDAKSPRSSFGAEVLSGSGFYGQNVPGLDGTDEDKATLDRLGAGSSSFTAASADKKVNDYDPYGPRSSKTEAFKVEEEDEDAHSTLIGRSSPALPSSLSLHSPMSGAGKAQMSHRHERGSAGHDHHHRQDRQDQPESPSQQRHQQSSPPAKAAPSSTFSAYSSNNNSLVGDISSILNEKKSASGGNPTSKPPTVSPMLPKSSSSSWSFGSWVSSAVAVASEKIDKAYETLDPEYSRMKARGGSGSAESGSGGGLEDHYSRLGGDSPKPGYVVGGSSLALGLASIAVPSSQGAASTAAQGSGSGYGAGSGSDAHAQHVSHAGSSFRDQEQQQHSPRLTRKNVGPR